MLLLTLFLLALLACNALYCGQRVIIDFRNSRQVQVAYGLLALSGTIVAFAAATWALLASLAHY